MEIVSGLTVPAYLLRAGSDGYREEREVASGVDGGRQKYGSHRERCDPRGSTVPQGA